MISTPMLIFVAVFLVLLTIFAIIAFRLKSKQIKTLTNKVEELGKEIESLKRFDLNAGSIQKSYLQFIYNLSHEVSNPLQSVQANLENMVDCSPDEVGRWKQYYAIIQQEMKRLSALTENLRLLSQLESDTRRINREPVNLRSVIENVMMAQADRASGKNINMKYQGPNRPAKILGNRDHLYQVIINLMDNSIKYSKEFGGEIVISLSEFDNFVRVMVTDNGLGIPEKDIPYIFDTAYRSLNKLTLRRKGSGLGLAIVKRIVDQHNGEIAVDSNVGEGTKITIDLPIYKPE